MKRLLPAVLMTVAVACGGSPGTEPTTVSAATTTTTAAGTTTTTSAATTTTEAPGLEGEELLACMVGGWTLDTDAFEAEVQTILDPDRDYHLVTVASGGGDLRVTSDSTLTVVFDSFTVTDLPVPEDDGPPSPGVIIESRQVASGEATAVFELDGTVLSVTETSGPGLDVRGWYLEQGVSALQESSSATFHPGAMVFGVETSPPRAPTDVTVACDAERLAVGTLFDPLSVDAPRAVWLRSDGDGR